MRTGGVINVASVAGFAAAPGSVKLQRDQGLDDQLHGRDCRGTRVKGSPVKVQALCPGFTLSEFHDVLHMDRSAIPKSLWMTADFVVEDSLRGFDRGKLIVIPGGVTS